WQARLTPLGQEANSVRQGHASPLIAAGFPASGTTDAPHCGGVASGRTAGLPAELGAHRVLAGLVAGELVVAAGVVEHEAQVRVDVVVQANDGAARLPVRDILVPDRVVARGQLPQATIDPGRAEHAGGGLVDLVPAVEQPAALQVPRLDVLVAAQRLAEAGAYVLALEEQRTERAGGLDAICGDAVATCARGSGDTQRRTAAARVVRGGAEVGRTAIGILLAGPATEVQGAVGGVDRREGHASGGAHAFVAGARRAAQVEHGEAGGVVVAGTLVAHALLELAPAEQAGGRGERPLHHEDLVGAGQLFHRAVRLEVADGQLAAAQAGGDPGIAQAVEVAAGGEVLLQLVVPAQGLAGQGQACAAELAGAGGRGQVAVEG